MKTSEAKVVALMVPLPAQGHLNQLLHLAVVLSSPSIAVHFAAPAAHNRQARVRFQGWDPKAISTIQFHDLPFPDVHTPPPDTSNPVKFPAHLQPVFDAAVTHLHAPLAALIRMLSDGAQRLVVIHDTLMSFVAEEAAAIRNAEAYVFRSVSAFTNLFFLLASIPKGALPDELKPEVLFPSLPNLSLTTCFTQEFLNLIHKQMDKMKFDVGQIFNSCRPIEGKFLDLIAMLPLDMGTHPWALGPLNPLIGSNSTSRSSHPCMKWLGMQPPGSVLYVSFGTMSQMSHQQILQLAEGLKRCNHRFLWVLREADQGDIFSENGNGYELPECYEEAVQGMGLVVKDWAPQVEILAHKATGGFMSHCGWNSCIESLSAGVPIVAWPLASDQPRNATLITEVLKVGVAVLDWARWDQLVLADEIELAVNKLMKSEEGTEVKRRANELGVAIRGAPRADLDSFVAHISR